MDHMMPGMDGIEATRIIRNEIDSEYARTVPIIALTANALLGNDTMFLENGFQAFLAKPIDILRMDNILNIWVRDKAKEKKLKKDAEQALAQTTEQTTEPSTAQTSEQTIKQSEAQTTERSTQQAGSSKLLKNGVIPGLDIAEGLARLDNDEESYVRILKSYITHIPEFAETVRQETTGDLYKYRIAVHGIKGSSRGIGAHDLGTKAEELENAAKKGDTSFIQNNTGPFLASVGNFITVLEGFIKALDAQAEQPE